MRSLQIKNIPNELYDALRARARRSGTTVSEEALILLRGSIPSRKQIRDRKIFFHKIMKLKPVDRSGDRFQTTEEMQREGRER